MSDKNINTFKIKISHKYVTSALRDKSHRMFIVIQRYDIIAVTIFRANVQRLGVCGRLMVLTSW